MTVIEESQTDFFDMVAEARSYQKKVDDLLSAIMDECRILGQHHIKLDFNVVPVAVDRALSYRSLDGTDVVESITGGGVHPVFTPYVNTYKCGVYAISKGKSKTIYIGANEIHNYRNNVYDRVIRFGKAIHNRMHYSETHSAGEKYRSLYGEDTSDLYLSFIFYDQFTPQMIAMMHELKLRCTDIEYLMIKKFSSQYLLNVIRK